MCILVAIAITTIILTNLSLAQPWKTDTMKRNVSHFTDGK